MQTIHVHAAFGDHVPRHGTVDAARNEQKSASRRTYGHAARALLKIAEHERRSVFSDVDMNGLFGRVHVHFQRWNGFQYLAADMRV